VLKFGEIACNEAPQADLAAMPNLTAFDALIFAPI